MSSYTFAPRDLPIAGFWDVVVVGGGPAGSAAAIAAARMGAKTLLIEASGMLGGSGTSSLVPAWCPFSDKEKIIYRGIAEEVLNLCKAGQPHVASDALDWVPIDPERLKRVYDQLVTQAGATVLFHTTLAAVEKVNNDEIEVLIVCSKSGLSAVKSKIYVDCTGDADVCAAAGAAFAKGDDVGEMMPATHCFILSNVNTGVYLSTYKGGIGLHANNQESPIYRIIRSGKYPLISDAHICSNLIGPGTVGFNAGHIWNVDNTDPGSVSNGLILGRRIAEQFRQALAEYCPDAFSEAFLVATGNTIGIRETRRVIGEYTLTFEDYISRRSFADEICRNSYFIDIHAAEKEAFNDPEKSKEWEGKTFRYEKGESHGIPYRCLIPKGWRNLLVAGRSISCERIVQGSIRVMPACLAMGEAAGTAAAIAAATQAGEVDAVSPEHLRQTLRGNGAYLPEHRSES